ncbi:MAG: LysR family transcriptional regulator [Proteobacteria bacterium]|nr:LysR family transcriptional regulator [Pseudomonadota bacterium]
MDLKQLEYFVHVAEMGSFTRAATLLRVAQPALSRQVRSLEVELRQPLLDRNGRGVTLTEAGKRLLAHARGILQQVERARVDLEDQRGAATGRLAIALPPSVSRTLTGPLVRAFRERLPRAALSVVEGLSAYALEWLAIGRVDCAVVYNVTPSPAIDLQPLLDERLYLVSARRGRAARQGRPIGLREVAELELVIPSRPHSMRMLLEAALAAEACRARVALEIESVPAILDLVLQGGCHAVLAENAIRGSGQPEAFQLRPIGPPPLVATLWMATSAQRPRGPLIEQGTALVAELLQQGGA